MPALVRWNLFAESSRLRARLDRMFQDCSWSGRCAWPQAIAVVREDGRLVVRVAARALAHDPIAPKPITAKRIELELEEFTLAAFGDDQGHTQRARRDRARDERRHRPSSGAMAPVAGVDAKRKARGSAHPARRRSNTRPTA